MAFGFISDAVDGVKKTVSDGADAISNTASKAWSDSVSGAIGLAKGSAGVAGDVIDFAKEDPLAVIPGVNSFNLSSKGLGVISDLTENVPVLGKVTGALADGSSYVANLQTIAFKSAGNVAIDNTVNGLGDLLSVATRPLGFELPEVDLVDNVDLSNASLPEKIVGIVGQGIGFALPVGFAAKGLSTIPKVAALAESGALGATLSKALPAAVAGFVASSEGSLEERLINGSAAGLSFGLTQKAPISAILPKGAADALNKFIASGGNFLIRPALINEFNTLIPGGGQPPTLSEGLFAPAIDVR